MLELELGEQTFAVREYSADNRRKENVCKTTCMTLLVVVVVIGLVFFLPQLLPRLSGYSTPNSVESPSCLNAHSNSSCQYDYLIV